MVDYLDPWPLPPVSALLELAEATLEAGELDDALVLAQEAAAICEAALEGLRPASGPASG